MDGSTHDATTQYLTVSEVAGSLRVSNMTVHRLISAGDLAAVRVGRSVRLRAHDVDEYLSGRLIKAG